MYFRELIEYQDLEAEKQNIIAKVSGLSADNEQDAALLDRIYKILNSGAIGTNITNSKHISSRGGSALRIIEDQYAWTQKPNGNTVSLEQQTIKSAEIRDMHGLATTLYKKSYAMYKTAIGGN